jgi:hypothetical protein
MNVTWTYCSDACLFVLLDCSNATVAVTVYYKISID